MLILETLFQSFLLVAMTEMGDKTQLLAFILATRFRKPLPVLAGIFAATILNHLLAAYIGAWLSSLVSENTLRWILALTFFAFALWVLIPDKDEDIEESPRFGAFLTTLIAFFIAEMGDKTQLSTVALAAKYQDAILVTIGTTAGMMFSDGLAVLFGERITKVLPLLWMRRISAALFIVFGLLVLLPNS